METPFSALLGQPYYFQIGFAFPGLPPSALGAGPAATTSLHPTKQAQFLCLRDVMFLKLASRSGFLVPSPEPFLATQTVQIATGRDVCVCVCGLERLGLGRLARCRSGRRPARGASGSDNWRRVWVSVAAGVTNMTQSGTVTGQGGAFVLRSHTLFPSQNQVRGCGVYLVSKASDLTASAGRGRDTCAYPESV